MRTVSFPWYDYPFLRAAYEEFWSVVRERLCRAGVDNLPVGLTHSTDLDGVLTDSPLLCSQTCGYDIAIEYPRPLVMICTPAYAISGCPPGHYRSAIVVPNTSSRRDVTDLAGARFVANDLRSWSGYHCVRRFHQTFSRLSFSGGHRQSLRILNAGDSDVAAIDAVAWELHRRHDPSLIQDLRVLAWTEPAPAPPLVTSVSTSRYELHVFRNALRSVVIDRPRLCDRLLIDGFRVFGPAAYAFMKPPARKQRPAFQLQ